MNKKRSKKTYWAVFILAIIAVFGLGALIFFIFNWEKLTALLYKPRSSKIPIGINLNLPGEISFHDLVNDNPTALIIPKRNHLQKAAQAPLILTKNLNVPWAIAWLPDETMLVTERSGFLTHLSKTGEIIGRNELPEVLKSGEGGLLGLAVHPEFINNNKIFLVETINKETNGKKTRVNRLARYEYDPKTEKLSLDKVITDQIEAGTSNNGGRLEWGPDNHLYLTTGDAEQPEFAQNIESLNGKILRYTSDGEIPDDNPFQNAVYSWGHRNSQGLAWDEQGRLWAVEHGPSGVKSGHDEINLIIKGGNYGWPEITGTQTKEGMISPVLESGENETWAPGDILINDTELFFTGLRGESLYQTTINNEKLENLERNFPSNYGRLRFLTKGTNGNFYFSTSNTDGRGQIRFGDDHIFEIDPQNFTR